MGFKVKYDDLTEEYDIDLGDGNWLTISGANRQVWANKVCEMLNEQPLDNFIKDK